MELVKRIIGCLPFAQLYLYPFERNLLGIFIEALPENFRELSKKQIALMNIAQRGGDYEVFIFGKARFLKPNMPKNLLLPVGKGDVRLMKLVIEAGGEKFNAVLHCQDGMLFTINFGQSYKKVRFVSCIGVLKSALISNADQEDGMS